MNMIIYSWKRSESGKVSCSENEFNISMLLLSNMLSFLFKQMKAKSLSSLWLWISKYDFLNTHSQDAKTYFLKKKSVPWRISLGLLMLKQDEKSSFPALWLLRTSNLLTLLVTTQKGVLGDNIPHIHWPNNF